jgi:hypothetical protein
MNATVMVVVSRVLTVTFLLMIVLLMWILVEKMENAKMGTLAGHVTVTTVILEPRAKLPIPVLIISVATMVLALLWAILVFSFVPVKRVSLVCCVIPATRVSLVQIAT